MAIAKPDAGPLVLKKGNRWLSLVSSVHWADSMASETCGRDIVSQIRCVEPFERPCCALHVDAPDK